MAGVNPAFTMLVDENGFPVPPDNSKDCFDPLRDEGTLSCEDICVPVPTLGEWGLLSLGLMLLTGGKLQRLQLERARRATQ